MISSAQIEWNGVPIDICTLERLRRHWLDIQDSLIAAIDADFGVFDGRTFKHNRFTVYLENAGIPWPQLVSGELDMSDKAFREMSRVYPQVASLRELRAALSKMRLNALEVGADGRSRCLLSPFQARTGRNQPSNSRFIFGPSVWLRGLIKPPPGYGIAYIDWEQQEFGIAAALSGDPAMLAAYTIGDPYLEFAKQAGAVPADATKKSHPTERDQFKACALGVQYGMAAYSLASRIGQPPIVARRLLELHRETYPKFWRWSNGAVSHALLNNYLYTVFRWYVHIGPDFNPRSLSNFPMQANGAEMLRLACCLATERGIEVCAPVHDAVLIAAPLDRLDYDVERMRMAMTEASRVVLEGFELRTEVAVVRYPDRYMDEKRGRVMWDKVMTLLDGAELEAA